MALAFYVDKPDGLATAFASHDEYMAIFTYFLRGKDSENKDSVIPLSPDVDECYTAPYCFMPKPNNHHHNDYNHNHNQYSQQQQHHHKHAGFLVFAAQVPWLESYFPIASPSNNNNFNIRTEDIERRGPHHQARDWMKRSSHSKLSVPILGSVEEFQDKLGLKDEEVITFTKDGRYPTEWDVSQSLGKYMLGTFSVSPE